MLREGSCHRLYRTLNPFEFQGQVSLSGQPKGAGDATRFAYRHFSEKGQITRHRLDLVLVIW